MDPTLSAGVVAFVVFAGTLLSLEIGFRWGLRDERRDAALVHEGVGAVEASSFALLGLLLAFSFSAATTRLESKRQVIVTEANAIGTAYLRVDVLPPDTQPPIRQQFKRLLEARVRAYEERFDPARAGLEFEKATDAQQRIWSLGVAATASSPKEVGMLVLPAINEMIDSGSTRAVTLQAHLPTLIVGLLVGSTLLSGLLAGHAMAKCRRRSWLHETVYALLLAITVYTVIDLDHPRFGLINIDAAYRTLIDLRDAIK